MRKVSHMAKVFAVVLLSLTSHVVLAADEGIKVKGFVEAGFDWASDATVNGIGSNNTFGVNDGAVYLSKDLDGGMVFVDLPFKWDSSNSNSTNGASSSNFAVGTGKAQAYIQYKYDFGLNWELGQFDKYLGYEKNDTKDIRFTSHTLLKTTLLPQVHTGLKIAYDLEPIQIAAMVANPHDQSQMNGRLPDVGGMLAFISEMLRLKFGLLHSNNQGTSGVSPDTLYDFIIGVNYGALAVDLEVVLNKLGGGTSASGVAMELGYGFTDTIGAAARGEVLARASGVHQLTNITVGPQFWMSKDLQIKLDLSIAGTKATSTGSTTTTTSAALAGSYDI